MLLHFFRRLIDLSINCCLLVAWGLFFFAAYEAYVWFLDFHTYVEGEQVINTASLIFWEANLPTDPSKSNLFVTILADCTAMGIICGICFELIDDGSIELLGVILFSVAVGTITASQHGSQNGALLATCFASSCLLICLLRYLTKKMWRVTPVWLEL